jgi:hypothetical protein
MVAVMDAAADLPPDKRDVFLQRFAARLKLRDDRQPLSDAELNKVIRTDRSGVRPITGASSVTKVIMVDSTRLRRPARSNRI